MPWINTILNKEQPICLFFLCVELLVDTNSNINASYKWQDIKSFPNSPTAVEPMALTCWLAGLGPQIDILLISHRYLDMAVVDLRDQKNKTNDNTSVQYFEVWLPSNFEEVSGFCCDLLTVRLCMGQVVYNHPSWHSWEFKGYVHCIKSFDFVSMAECQTWSWKLLVFLILIEHYECGASIICVKQEEERKESKKEGKKENRGN